MDEKENGSAGQKVIVFADDNKPNGLTWAKYGKSIHRYRYWLLGFTLVGAIAGYLSAALILNPKREKMSLTFSYDIPLRKDANSGTSTYFDGSAFDYRAMISEDNVKAVAEKTDKDGNLLFSVDADKLIEKNALSVTETKAEDASVPPSYTLTTNPSYFASSRQAKSFLQAVAMTLADQAEEKLQGYRLSNPLDSINTQTTFDSDLSLLDRQYQLLENTYTSLSSRFGSDAFITDTDTVAMAKTAFETNYAGASSNLFQEMKASLSTSLYVKFTNTPEGVEAALSKLNRQLESSKDLLRQENAQIENYKTVLATYQGMKSTTTAFDDMTKAYYQAMEQRENTLTYFVSLGMKLADDATSSDRYNPDKYVSSGGGRIGKMKEVQSGSEEGKAWASECASFRDLVTTYQGEMKESTTDAENAVKTLYGKYAASGIRYNSVTGITDSGHVSGALTGLLGAAVVFLVASLIGGGIYAAHPENDTKKTNTEEKKA